LVFGSTGRGWLPDAFGQDLEFSGLEASNAQKAVVDGAQRIADLTDRPVKVTEDGGQVGARAEGRPAAGDHEHPRRSVVSHGVDGLGKRGLQGGRHGVALLRLVEREDADAFGGSVFKKDEAHASIQPYEAAAGVEGRPVQ